MKKVIELDEYFPTGESSVQPILLWGSGRRVDTTRVSKYASDALDYIKSVTPEPGKTILLVNALGAEETYGPNRNGDGFPEFPVPARGRALTASRRWFVPPGEELVNHYASFEKNPAHAFKHHVNKDPEKASGVVKRAFWNPRMHRVELLISIDNEKDPEWAQRAQDGEFVPVSMGCRIKRDVCARCGNEAPTRADYCDHVKYNMNAIDKNGFKDYVHNPSPDFFDISRVFRPADRTGYTLKKVAEVHSVRLSADLGAESEDLAFKSAVAQKLSDIDKVIHGEVAGAVTLSPDQRRFIINVKKQLEPRAKASARLDTDKLSAWPLGAVLRTAAENGVVLRDDEFIPLAVNKLAGQRVRVSPVLVAKTAAAARWTLSAFAERPEILNEILEDGVLESGKVAGDLQSLFSDVREKRAYAGELLYRSMVPEGIGLRPEEAPTTDLLHVGPYTTTRGAAIDAQDAITRNHLKRVLGGSALLLGAYKGLTAFPAIRRIKIPLAMGAAYLGSKLFSNKSRAGKTVMTEEGVPISNMTEMVKMSSVEGLVHLTECADIAAPAVDFSKIKLSALASADEVAAELGAIVLT